MAADDDSIKHLVAGGADEIRTYYDQWTTEYEKDVTDWGYMAPTIAAGLLAERVDREAQVLDAGCGTGLVGRALAAKGFHDVVGVDISPKSLDIAAETKAYRALAEVDFNAAPTDLLDENFAALLSVGVMTYMNDVDAVMREFARIVEPSGTIVVTERSDLFEQRKTGEVFETLAANGVLEIVDISEPMPYLPKLDDWESIEVRFGVFRRP